MTRGTFRGLESFPLDHWLPSLFLLFNSVSMLWTLLSASSFFSFIASAVLVAHGAGGGFNKYALALSIGLLLGVCNVWALEMVGRTVFERSKHHSESAREWCFRALYLGAALWILFAAFLGDLVMSAALRLTV
jgi:hypothetical protein